MCDNDVHQRPSTCNFDVFFKWFEPSPYQTCRSFTHTPLCPLSRHLWFFIIHPFAFLYHILLFLVHQSLLNFRMLSFHLKILRGYFIHSFVSQLASWPSSIVNHYMLERRYCIIVLLLMSLLVFVFSSLSYYTTIFIDFIILALLSLLSFPVLNLDHIVLLDFLIDINLIITSTIVIIWFLIRIFLIRITAVVTLLFNRVKLRIIPLRETVTYVLRRTTPNILNLILLGAIIY